MEVWSNEKLWEQELRQASVSIACLGFHKLSSARCCNNNACFSKVIKKRTWYATEEYQNSTIAIIEQLLLVNQSAYEPLNLENELRDSGN